MCSTHKHIHDSCLGNPMSQVVLDELWSHHTPVVTDWHLNERCYGALVGKNKKECVRIYGADQVKQWRRSFDVRPPAIRYLGYINDVITSSIYLNTHMCIVFALTHSDD